MQSDDKELLQKENLTLKRRQEDPQPLWVYNLLNYYAYLFYPPLYISGPVITYNAFISQVYIPQIAYSSWEVCKYGIRWVVDFILFEIWSHLFYVNAIATNSDNENVWKHLSVGWIIWLGLSALIFIWFKFLLIWRFARLWGLLDGIESPENMNRCICNNYSFEGFWRSWHRGYNQWLIRYIFIPLGGTKYKMYNVWVVFTFVAVWHDMKLNLVFWAWIICLSLMPEMLIKNFFKQPKLTPLWKKAWFKFLCVFAGSIIVILLIISNLVGFGMGYEGILRLIDLAMQPEGMLHIMASFILVFFSVNVMFYLRDKEEQSGETKGF